MHVTVFTNGFFLERAKREVSSELAGVGAVGHVRYVLHYVFEQHRLSCWRFFRRIVALPSDTHKHFVDPVFEAAFARVYRQLLSGEPVQCATTGEQLGPLPLPQAIVTPVSQLLHSRCDALTSSRQKNSTLESLQRLRKETGADVKLLIWYARVPSTLFFFHGPANRGGVGDVRAKVRAEAERRRTSPEEAFEEVSTWSRNDDRSSC